jgi:hypothetical protein
MTSIIENYLNNWIIVYQSGERVAGFLKEIRDGYLILNPFQSSRPKEDTLEYFLREEEPGYLIPLVNIKIEPSTEEDIKKDVYELNKYSKKIKNLNDFIRKDLKNNKR